VSEAAARPTEDAAGRTKPYAGRTKYDEPGRAQRYATRSRRRHEEEKRLVFRALEGIPPPAAVVDAPCGTGRMAAEFLARGVPVLCADLSPAMRDEAAASLTGTPGLLGVVPLDLEGPPPNEPAGDLVVCVRFLHHLPDEAARGRVLRTLAALSRRHVLVTFHHPVSLHHLARAARRVVTGRRGDRHAVTARRLAREARGCGLTLVRTAALAPGLRDLWVALFAKAQR
jgi:SAM-dependent methyltransferase